MDDARGAHLSNDGSARPAQTRSHASGAGRNVRVVIGEHDVFFPVDPLRRAWAKLGVEPVVVERAGHLLVDEEPERITDLIAELL